MNPALVSKFSLKQGATAVAGVSEFSGTSTSFTPATALTPNTVYTATISKGANDESGNSMAKEYSWSFTTGSVPDLTLPTVTVTNPLNSATGVALDQKIVATFSETMDQTTITKVTFTLKNGLTSVDGAVTYTGTQATFTSTQHLEPNTVYTGTITKGAMPPRPR